MQVRNQIITMAKAARAAAQELAMIPTPMKNTALRRIANALISQKDYIIRENEKDVTAARKAGYAAALVDRLLLDGKRIQGMAQCIMDTIRLHDPVGEVMKTLTRPNGLMIKKVRVPIGVIGIIYESRPNVTSDCIALCLKSGNAVILKGGTEALNSNKALFKVVQIALKGTKVTPEAVQFIQSTDRQAVQHLLELNEYVDLIVPRGGEGLIRFVAEHSRIPVIKHYKGICHTYVSQKANLKNARAICFNAKVQRPGVCNAMETLLVHRGIARTFLPAMIDELIQAGVEIRGCPQTRKIAQADIKAATVQDWDTEYLDLILSVKVVKNLKEAIAHINTHGSHHSEAIITEDKKEAEKFLQAIDAACVYVNASTRFTDGYEFGLGAEIGISTDKIHARGPMALEELTTYKYLVYGNGQVRS